MLNEKKILDFKIKDSRLIQQDEVKDCQARYYVVQQDIRMLSAEIYRLSKLPYADWNNINKMKTIDQQIQYLEELLAAYERDLKGLE